MKATRPPIYEYSESEERWNIATHAFGFILSLVGLVFLSFRESNDLTARLSLMLFGSSLCILYLASTLYHKAIKPRRRAILNIIDHAAIYILIAGTYTPFTLITLKGNIGQTIFYIAWGMAVIGVILKLFFTGRFNVLSTILYVGMGWLIIFAYEPLIEQLHPTALKWLFGGGIAYTLGAVLYSIKRIPYNHAVFHVFVLLGSFCHFCSIYFYVGLPL